MIIIKASWLRKLNTLAFTFYPFIFIRDENILNDASNLQHEKIHARQQLEMLLIFFYIWYYFEYALKARKYGLGMAYYRISFEREAYANDHDCDYLKKRGFWGWLKWV